MARATRCRAWSTATALVHADFDQLHGGSAVSVHGSAVSVHGSVASVHADFDQLHGDSAASAAVVTCEPLCRDVVEARDVVETPGSRRHWAHCGR